MWPCRKSPVSFLLVCCFDIRWRLHTPPCLFHVHSVQGPDSWTAAASKYKLWAVYSFTGAGCDPVAFCMCSMCSPPYGFCSAQTLGQSLFQMPWTFSYYAGTDLSWCCTCWSNIVTTFEYLQTTLFFTHVLHLLVKHCHYIFTAQPPGKTTA